MTSIIGKQTGRARVFAVALLLAAGCAANAHLSNMWRDPQYRGGVRRMYVVAMRRDPAQRRLMEESFVDAFARHGVDAAASYRDFPSTLPDSGQILDAVERGKFDGVLVVSRLDTRTVQRYVPGYVSTQTYLGWNRWIGRYQTYYADVYEPGYVETDRVVRHRVDLWATSNGGDLVWTATGNSLDPTSADEVNEGLTKKVVHELAEQGIIPD